MVAYARKQITADEFTSAAYLLTNRCVRQSYFLGKDEESGFDFSHRKQWLVDRLEHIVENGFCMEVHAFSVMCNHFHLVVTTRPDVVNSLSDEQVVRRWWSLFPSKPKNRQTIDDAQEIYVKKHLNDSGWIRLRRRRLCSISWLMRCLSEPIARRANLEDKKKGRFWQGRFDSRILLDETSLTRACAYVDLNPYMAGLSRCVVAEITKTSLALRAKREFASVSTKGMEPVFYANCISPSCTTRLRLSFCDYRALCEKLAQVKMRKKRERYLEYKRILCQRFDEEIVTCSYAVGSKEGIQSFSISKGRTGRYRTTAQSMIQMI